MRILLVGHGRMGRLVESLAADYGCEIAGIVNRPAGTGGAGPRGAAGSGADPVGPVVPVGPVHDDRWERWSGAPGRDAIDVAIDFSSPDAVMINLPALARRRINVVLGTTGWNDHDAALRTIVAGAGIGIVAAPNFSTGAVLFESIAAHAAKLLARQPDFGAFVHEAHHSSKKDAPSGTALRLERAMRDAGFSRPIDMASTRAGSIPGTHTIGFDGPAETITLTHAARDRTAFARGALAAAQWVKGKQGWFTMQDVLGLHEPVAEGRPPVSRRKEGLSTGFADGEGSPRTTAEE
jgi:4-hydroxy-tetrahydrodipicolinate reductase